MPTMLCSTPCEGLGLALPNQGRSRSYRRASAGLCLSDRAQGMEMLLISICLAFLALFLRQNQCEGSFSAPLRVKGGVCRGKGWKNTQQTRNFSCNFSCLQLLYIGLIRT